MATLIPTLGSCVSRMTSGERRLAERLEAKLDDDYLLWYDVPMGPSNAHPDFCVLHPRRGMLILEVKDWRLSTLHKIDRHTWEILVNGQTKCVINPLEQARQYAHQVVNALERDPQLVHAEGSHRGKLAFPWSYGVVLANITRRQFEQAELQHAIDPDRVLCQDEMLEGVEPEALQSRLWGMFPFMMRGVMSLPQCDRVRWIMFPQVRVPSSDDLFDSDTNEEAELPEIMRVMDLQQEQLARSLGDGHRVIHGVAGSGKTMILGYRAELLARTSGLNSKPILVLCFNEPLAVKLAATMASKDLGGRVHVRHFHKWCRDQLVTFGQTLPGKMGAQQYVQALVDGVIRSVENRQIPSGQYQAVLIDEGHDFAPEWLKLVTQMVDPSTNSLLLLYDDAQSIYERRRTQQFSFKSVGIQAQGRTTILKVNYRNTRQILQVAAAIAADLLTPDDSDEDGIPLLKPIGCGRDGEAPLIIRLPTLHEEVWAIATSLRQAHQQGHAWGEMAVLCADWKTMDLCAAVFAEQRLPSNVRKGTGDYRPDANVIQIMTMRVSKGLEFPVVALPGIGHLPATGDDEKEAARVLYVAATRATEKLVLGLGGNSSFAARLSAQARTGVK
ncbi:DEAD/DEAH box helicase [Roseateles sp. BYS96W]|uniref:DEAD/DEAH box helicase n=1 Tax=Pelomonas nitida TaxID=3299027 RepID=A0ABW7GAX4_9BURK